MPVFSFTCFISPVLLLFVSMFMSLFSFCFFYFSFYISPLSLCPNFSVFLPALPSAHTNTHSHCRISILPYLLAELLLLQCFCTHFFSQHFEPLETAKKGMLKLLLERLSYSWYVFCSAFSTIFQKYVQHFPILVLMEDSC